MIEDLPRLAPDSARGARTVARCHDRLAAHRRRFSERDNANVEARNRPLNARVPGAERLLAAGLCVAYLIAMAGDLFSIAARR